MANETLTSSTLDDGFVSAEEGEEEEDPWAKYPFGIETQISHATAFLSVIGSLWIVVDILKDRKKWERPFYRIILGLSLFDTMSSLWMFIGVWVHENPNNSGRFGLKTTSAACETSGFFIYWASITIPLYNAALAGYFLLTVKYGWKEFRVSKAYEKFVHVPIVLAGLIPTVVALILDMHNPYYFYCYATENGSVGRGNSNLALVFLCIFWVIIFGTTIFVTGAMVMIYLKVREVMRKADQFSFERSLRDHSSLQPSSWSASLFRDSTTFSLAGVATLESRHRRPLQTRRTQLSDRVRSVARMGLMYTIPFYLTWLLPTIFTLMVFLSWRTGNDEWMTPLNQFVIVVYTGLMLPFQGFFNWIIYMLPRFATFRKKYLNHFCNGWNNKLFCCCEPQNGANSNDRIVPSNKSEDANAKNSSDDHESTMRTSNNKLDITPAKGSIGGYGGDTNSNLSPIPVEGRRDGTMDIVQDSNDFDSDIESLPEETEDMERMSSTIDES